MENTFNEVGPEGLTDNPFKLIGKDWMLITAGAKGSFNTMTGAWGGLGVMWNKNVAFCVVRPTRYTFEFMERSSQFTLSFFDEQYRDILTYCGTKSGRDVNKVAGAGITPVVSDKGIYFAEARLVLICKKIYFQDLRPGNFLVPEVEEFYPLKDYHRMYVGELVQCLTR